MKPGVTCQKLASLNKISPVTEKTHLLQRSVSCLRFLGHILQCGQNLLNFFNYKNNVCLVKNI